MICACPPRPSRAVENVRLSRYARARLVGFLLPGSPVPPSPPLDECGAKVTYGSMSMPYSRLFWKQSKHTKVLNQSQATG